jgi:hypothetical protein
MADISRATSFGKLNPILYKAIEGATVFASCAATRTSSSCTG